MLEKKESRESLKSEIEWKEYIGKDVEEKAKKLGMRVIRPKLNQIFVDIDSEEDYSWFYSAVEMYKKTSKLNYIVAIEDRPSKSGLPHRHVIISFQYRLNLGTRQLLQSVFGSDRTRELLAAISYVNGESCQSLFFEPLVKKDDK